METKHISDVPELMKQWNWQKNAEMGIVPENISIASKKKVFWKCHICGGEWETAPQYRKRMGVHIVQILKHFQVLMIFRLFFQILRQNGICKKIILYGRKMLQKVQEKKYGGFVQKVTLMICL